MGFADSFGEFHGLRRFWKRDNDDGAADGVHTSPGGVGTHERGIRGGPQQGRSKRRAWAMLDGNGTNDDGVGWTLYALRGSQIFFSFVGICINGALASTQKKWDVGPSGLVIFSYHLSLSSIVFLLIGVLFNSLFMLLVPVLNEKKGSFRRLAGALKQFRPAVTLNTFQTVLILILAFTMTISSNVKGCKSPDSDPNADEEGYKDILPGFCRNKRALTAFIWFAFFSSLLSLIQVIFIWRRSRSAPKIPGFIPPADGDKDTWNADVEAGLGYDSLDADREDEAYHGQGTSPPMSAQDSLGGYGTGGFAARAHAATQARQSNTFYDAGRPFDDPTPRGYGAAPYNSTEARDLAPAYDDPYDRIRRERLGQ
ncbi:hypothetical protein EMMF5_005420 [Cystobasidiomycetes sp. EMM_F5]